MSDHSSKKVNSYLQTDHMELQTLFSKIKALQELNKLVLPLLGEDIAKFCQVANLVEGRLVILAANGSIATQLRFMTPDLLKKMAGLPALKSIRDIVCKVAPGNAAPAAKMEPSLSRGLPPLSTYAADIVREIAESIKDPALKMMLQKIAEHTK